MQLRVNGTTLSCETLGEGATCLCLHGGPGTDSSGLRRSLAPLAEALGVRLVFYDHRGHGRSEWVPVEQCTQDQLVADVEGVREALGLGRVHVLGISWGGFLALMYAARHPDSLRSLAVGRRGQPRLHAAGRGQRSGVRRRRSSGRPTRRCGTARSPTMRDSGARSTRSGRSTSSISGWLPTAWPRAATRATGWPSAVRHRARVRALRRGRARGVHAAPRRAAGWRPLTLTCRSSARPSATGRGRRRSEWGRIPRSPAG
jgi:pimeloyl-ACP methyl ester carboxylesterase